MPANSIGKNTSYEHSCYEIWWNDNDRKLTLRINGQGKAGFILPVKSKDISGFVDCFARHCPPDSKGDAYFPVAEAIADIAATKTTKFGSCESCGTRLYRFGGYYGSGMCGVCYQGDSSLLEERGGTW
ncbi:MAG: hypothetical protein AAGA46_00135 [Cyanobacteria bacterium P01_F01_bin.13]